MKNEKKLHKTKEKSKKKKVSIFSKLLTILIIAIVIAIILGISCLITTFKYKQYTDKMYIYRYNELYVDGKATAYKKATNLDMYKVLIGSINNTLDVKTFKFVSKTEGMTDDDVWFEVAKKMNLTMRIKDNDANKKAKYIDAVITAMRLIETTLDVQVEETNLNMSKSKLNKFSDTDKSYIAQAVTLGIIPNDNSALDNKKLIKGELNKLVIEICNKFSTVYYKNIILDEQGNLVANDVKLVLDEEKLPTNANEYPYVVDNIEKNIYEVDLKVENKNDFKNPVKTYAEMGDLYGQIDELVTGYFKDILNIDYKTINEIDFLAALNNSSIYTLTLDDVSDYVEYVKENEIILKGKVQALLPIMYYSGERYIVRTKVTFEIVNSKTNKDILYNDLGNDITYTGNEFTMYVDMPLSTTLNSRSQLIEMICLAKNMITKNNNISFSRTKGGIINEKIK